MPRKKLIEVALPLEAINEASAREKSIRHGHPSTLHLWWARRPLATARAVIFASLVDDPDNPDAPPAFVEACKRLDAGANTATKDTPRMRLFDFIERLVQWESTTDESILAQARHLILLATDGNPPPLLDPFAGGGSIPLEAQRLGLEAHASDLNPVAVMINKAQIEIPPRFANLPPVNPHDSAKGTGGNAQWRGTSGLAADVRYYGEWMREKAWERIGHLYPKLSRGVAPLHPHEGETVIAWLWARTVKSPNPAVNAPVPLVRSFILSKKKGRECWAKPIVETHAGGYIIRFEVSQGTPPKGQDGTMNRQGGTCIISGVSITWDYIRTEGKEGRMGAMLMAIVTEGQGGRSYYSPSPEHAELADQAQPAWKPVGDIPEQALGFRVQLYGMDEYNKLFTPRQLVALTTFSDLVAEAREQIYQDAMAAGLPADDGPLRDGGRGARAYAEAVSVYLAFAINRTSDRSSSIASWDITRESIRNTFARQAIPMTWDYVEANILGESTGSFVGNIDLVSKFLDEIPQMTQGFVSQQDASQVETQAVTLSTDPPYYDNIGYADLSDFFYVWMRRNLREVYPDLFATVLVPKEAELIASPYRHGGKEAANRHFEGGMQATFSNIRRFITPAYPLTVYYAFKQQETESVEEEEGEEGAQDGLQSAPTGRVSTGWETMLTSLIQAGFSIDGTWPIRTELKTRSVASGTNALASSIVLVCRPRPDDAPITSRRDFLAALRQELPRALVDLQSGNIAPVDLAQASIGPGMAIYSRHAAVLEADGTRMSVRTALGLINQALDAYLAEQDGQMDTYSRFTVAWFEQFAFKQGEYGQAEVLARAKNTIVEAAGIMEAQGGKVRLRHWREYDPSAWNPNSATVWEAVHHLLERLHSYGETGAARLLLKMSSEMAANARQLAYRLYNICERKNWAEHARDYNALVISWTGIEEVVLRLREAAASGQATDQPELL